MNVSLDISNINILKIKPKGNNKCIIGVITFDTFNKIIKNYGLKENKKDWRYKIVLLELNLLLKEIVSINIYKTIIKYNIPNFSNNKLVVKIILDNNNKIYFSSQYYISKFIKKSLLYSFFKSLINT